MNEWIVKRGRRGRRRHRMERWEAGINLYKTHLSSTTMEKVKAHDRYKHICYWVLRLLYFDSLVSTQVGSFDSIPLRYLAWILFCFFTAQSFGSLFCKCSVHIYKGQNLLFDELQLQVVCGTETCREELSAGSSLEGFSIVQPKHTILTTHKGCWVL